ncbi:hypothetical protein B0H34DRAFT_670694 [Crassisporium funariophilum]|nr:hypothetical protein B0H34DRAFT_670694 [Crassisporium funariophilum]
MYTNLPAINTSRSLGSWSFRESHPKVALASAVAGAGLIIAGSTVLIPAAAVASLNAVGFTASGVAAGSVASAAQSTFWGASTGGLFSTFQAVGATSVASSTGTILSSIAAVVGGGATLAASRGTTPKAKDNGFKNSKPLS